MSKKDYHEVWDNCLKIIKDNIPAKSYDTWFKPIIPKKLVQNILTIQVPSSFFYEYLEEHYIDLMSKALKKELGANAKLEYSVVMEQSSNGKDGSGAKTIKLPGGSPATEKSNNATQDVAQIKNPFVIPGVKKVDVDSQLNPKFTFDNFVEGKCNNLARSAGLSIAEQPGETPFNPLMIYGNAGLGKTHLEQAIGLHAQKRFPNKRVLYVTAENFITQFTESIRNNNRNDFVHFYQMIDLLIIDDIQDLGGLDKTQNTFFHIFNHLHQLGKQLILTSDKAPSELERLEKRLLSRFKWGLTAELQVPGTETRMGIINRKLYNTGATMPEEVKEFLANHITNSVREIEGTIISLLAHATLTRQEITVELASEVMNRLIKDRKREITLEQIQSTVCDYFDLSINELHSKSRKRDIVQARQIAMFFAKKHTKHSLTTIGSKIGHKDHATVLHANRTVRNLMETDKRFKGHVQELDRLMSS